MKNIAIASLWLRIRIALGRMNPVIAGGVLLLAASAGTVAWLAHARIQLEQDYEAARREAARPAPPPQAVQAPPPSADQNLALFYDSLGQRRTVDRQLKDLFALAQKHGLVLRQGEYRSSHDRAARFYTYQLNLPVKGRYEAIWQFAFDALQAVPHASLDDVSFRRDAIGDEHVEARLRMTLYLSAATGAPQ
ncbi:hypothetical protein [Massilia consociata]|uniref:Transmembrane protein n=1 Tax=Massilia consociata TaxID=760117 RepID=A0ABV6FC19_9BURK